MQYREFVSHSSLEILCSGLARSKPENMREAVDKSIMLSILLAGRLEESKVAPWCKDNPIKNSVHAAKVIMNAGK